MTTKKTNQVAQPKGNKGTTQAPTYATRFVAIDSHLTERRGSTESVYGLAGERPAGRKLAQDIANACNQLHSTGYEIISIVPVTSGRVTEATVQAATPVHGRTYSKSVPVETEETSSRDAFESFLLSVQPTEVRHYVDTGVGYSVTDGVVITAKLRD